MKRRFDMVLYEERVSVVTAFLETESELDLTVRQEMEVNIRLPGFYGC